LEGFVIVTKSTDIKKPAEAGYIFDGLVSSRFFPIGLLLLRPSQSAIAYSLVYLSHHMPMALHDRLHILGTCLYTYH
jgi:hypothetical protein